ncbi:MAG: UDP-glucose 4-epimerase [Candidatus Gottesmanbacteria bacterium GW2011_GWC2_39_8]|uniref:UDP-glucose 4-epimerase n=1 Tax=Candidatus Gottesmanbacteria bacterium GW2011_GWC2_39_8 TaxID=1618450 RepID=A0A0G0T5Z3_9BACT|nr:MAG: UDP-glucose 4-epimerase [Candidatus Gottesmanbacteria bacterium GW2011_GWC2_39_8]
MRMLVTGGSGFIGSHVVDKLLDAGHTLRVLDMKEPHRGDVEYFNGNILSREVVKQAIKDVDFIYHFAAASNIDLVKNNPLETIEFNIMGTAHLLEEARYNNIRRFVMASSVFVHDTRGHLYTTSKLASEMLCKDYHTLFSVPYTILRIGTAYGPRSRNADVISIFVQRALRNENLTIFGSGKQKRNFIYVEDIALACVAAINENANNKIFTIAGKKSITIEELAYTVKNIVNPASEIILKGDNNREDDYLGQIENLDFVQQEIGWKPEVNISEGIMKYVQWYKTSVMKTN